MKSFLRWGSVTLLVLATTGEISEETYDCEEAHAHMKACCPTFHTDAAYCDSGCSSHAQLTVQQSKCILDTSCEDLQSKGICARAAALNDHGPDSGPNPPVCP